jgi:hypothetical protein
MKIKATEPETPSDWIALIEHSCIDLPVVEIRSRFIDGGLFALLDLMLRRETVDA